MAPTLVGILIDYLKTSCDPTKGGATEFVPAAKLQKSAARVGFGKMAQVEPLAMPKREVR